MPNEYYHPTRQATLIVGLRDDGTCFTTLCVLNKRVASRGTLRYWFDSVHALKYVYTVEGVHRFMVIGMLREDYRLTRVKDFV